MKKDYRHYSYRLPKKEGLYDPYFEHDACGFGFVCQVKGEVSHQILKHGISILNNLKHRGGLGVEKESGDGAGILVKIPHEFLLQECRKIDIDLPGEGDYAVGQIFLPAKKNESETLKKIKTILEKYIKDEKQILLGWRKVPTSNHQLGYSATAKEPKIEQIFIKKSKKIDQDTFQRKLYLIRRQAEKEIQQLDLPGKDAFYPISFSNRTLVYKGQLVADQLEDFFLDLQDPLFKSSYAVVHSRFSTNTFPTWALAHPFRFLAHNGEINTKQGNINWFRARRSLFKSNYFSQQDMKKIFPLICEEDSDSAVFDSVLELLTLAGRPLPFAMMMMIPEAWENDQRMDPTKRSFYEFHANFTEPWDGPAAMVFCDGRYLGGTLDRNGLRPSRFTLYENDFLVMASETGVVDLGEDKVVQKGRLEPGKMLLVDLEANRIIPDDEIKSKIASEYPYSKWLKNKIRLEQIKRVNLKRNPPLERIRKRQKAFGYTQEEIRMIIAPMYETGAEPIGSMGSDTPLAILSRRSQNLFNYFHQLFAQVTNPPIDPIREKSFMSLRTYLGEQKNLLLSTASHAHTIEIDSPVLTNKDMEKIRWIDQYKFQAKTIHTIFRAKPGKLTQSINRIVREVVEAIQDEYKIIILSDRYMNSSQAAIPSLLVLSAVHQHLIRVGKRSCCSLIVESGEVREVHHFAVLLGYGANAINPYTAFDLFDDLKSNHLISTELSFAKGEKNYIQAVDKGLLKIISKMGISTIRSYTGAQIFEAVGIHQEVIDRFFTRTASRISGLTLDEIEKETLIRHRFAYKRAERLAHVTENDESPPVPDLSESTDFSLLEVGGNYHWRSRGEKHLFNPDTVHLIQQACRTNRREIYNQYTDLINQQDKDIYTLRGMLDFKPSKRRSIPLKEVEPVENIFKRFCTGAMSYGSISWEAHTTLALAMNQIGGRSNTGEGGEDPIRYRVRPDGYSLRSAIKQVASGRFGVTIHYLVNSDEIQIKIAQGAKPGEGGQLPGHKVDPIIAKVRHSTPGVGLISPPPHHDIYSIEDLAQLIYDLKCANPKGKVSVKLVSAAGVGTIAAGVAKGFADSVIIAGYDGGTGASPLTSIKHAGLPWELGLSETHQVLVKNRLRDRIVVQADGQMKTGRDLAIATLLGAEEWGVATLALVAMGCIMMRKCHLNTCPVGIATQRKELRKHFNGEALHVVRLFTFLAEDLREIMAELGIKTIDQMVGRYDLLAFKKPNHWKASTLDLTNLLYHQVEAGSKQYCCVPQYNIARENLDYQVLKKLKITSLTKNKKTLKLKIKNTNRAFGTIISSQITELMGEKKLKEDSLILNLNGSAGQSFAAFATQGITFRLEGEANDYFAKGLSGAKLILTKPVKSHFKSYDNTIMGNVSFYGATGGDAYIGGIGGERFCVRNSGANVVIEGVGAHGCEYMTGGKVIILGSVGNNFAAGMSGGIAYLFDRENQSKQKINREMVLIEDMEDSNEIQFVKKKIVLMKKHTGSEIADWILKNWVIAIKQFIKVIPIDYKNALEKLKSESKGKKGKVFVA